MEGSVLTFLKAEWKVSDTGSAHWASSVKNVGKTWEDNVVVIVILWKLDLQLPVQSVPIAT